MPRREWTVLVVSDDDTRVRQLRLSRNLIRAAIGSSLLVLSVLTSMAAGYVFAEHEEFAAGRLARKNALLTAELETIRDRVAQFELSLEDLSERDAKYRLLAGLDPLPAEVRQAGIGGPGTDVTGADALSGIDPAAGTLAHATTTDLSTLIRRARLLETSWEQATDALSDEYARLRSTPSIMPTSGYISSGFSRSRWHPILNRPRAHEGVDIVAVKGTPITAAANGRVIYAGRKGDYGLTVEVDHGFGYVTRYAHASKILVRRGQRVERGDEIAEVGQTGLAVAPHIHYEVLVNGRPRNPRDYILSGNALPD